MARIFVTRALPGRALDRLTAAGHEVTVHAGDLPPTRAELLAGVAVRRRAPEPPHRRASTPTLLAAAPSLRAIANYAVGCDNIDLAAADARGIPVGATPGVLTDATADLALALLLAAARRLPEAQAAVRDGALAHVGAARLARASSCAARAWRSSASGASGAPSPSAPPPSAWRSSRSAARTICTRRSHAPTPSASTSR